MRLTFPSCITAGIAGWRRPAANDNHYYSAYRLTEFGLGD